MLEKPDILLLDEPTNYLDEEHILWLKNYLKNYENAFILISHDVPFMDEVVNIIYHVHGLGITRYSMGYAEFERVFEEKKAQLESLAKVYQVKFLFFALQKARLHLYPKEELNQDLVLFLQLWHTLVPDEGKVIWSKKHRVGYMDQHAVLGKGKTTREALAEAFQYLFDIEAQINDTYMKMAEMSEDEMNAALENVGELQEELDNSDFYLIDAKVEETARGLGLTPLLDKDVAEL